MNTPDDPAFHEFFRETIGDEEEDAPRFERVWSAASACHRRHQRRVRVARWTAIAAVLVLGAFTFLRTSPPPQVSSPTSLPWRTAILLSEWRAPTDALIPPADPASLSLALPQ